MSSQPATTTPAQDVCTLDSSHRCDRCGARAYVQVGLAVSGLELYFCRHHYRRFWPVLFPQCAYVNDHSRQLFDGIKDDHWVEGKAQSLPPRQT